MKINKVFRDFLTKIYFIFHSPVLFISIICIVFFFFSLSLQKYTDNEKLTDIPPGWKFEKETLEKVNLNFLQISDKNYLLNKYSTGRIYKLYYYENNNSNTNTRRFLVFIPNERDKESGVLFIYFQDILGNFNYKYDAEVKSTGSEIFITQNYEKILFHLNYKALIYLFFSIIIYLVIYFIIYHMIQKKIKNKKEGRK